MGSRLLSGSISTAQQVNPLPVGSDHPKKAFTHNEIRAFLLNNAGTEIGMRVKLLLPMLGVQEKKALVELLELTYKSGFKNAQEQSPQQTTTRSEISDSFLPEQLSTKNPLNSSNEPATDIIDHTIEAILSHIKKGNPTLPAFPKIAQHILNILDDPGMTIQTMADEISLDQTIAVKIMTIANSVYYCSYKRSETIEQAVTKIGLNEVKRRLYVFASQEIYSFKSHRLNDISKLLAIHAAATGNIAYNLARLLKFDNPGSHLLYGLFHDIGKLWMLTLFEELVDSEKIDANLTKSALLKVFDTLHPRLGGYLLSKWNIGSEFVTLITNHHRPANPDDKTMMVVQFANAFAKQIGYMVHEERDIKDELDDLKGKLKLTPGVLETLAIEVDLVMKNRLL